MVTKVHIQHIMYFCPDSSVDAVKNNNNNNKLGELYVKEHFISGKIKGTLDN